MEGLRRRGLLPRESALLRTAVFSLENINKLGACIVRTILTPPQYSQLNAASANASSALSSSISMEKCQKRLGNQMMHVPDGDYQLAPGQVILV